MAKAFAWTGTGMWATQVFTWIATFTVARILTPTDYGLIGMASIYIGLVLEVSEFGLGMTVINLQDLTEEQTGQLNTLSILMGIVAFLLSCAVAYPLGSFFHTPRLPMLLMAMSLVFVITSVKTVPAALLQREMQFKTLAKIEGASYLAYAVGTLISAFLGFGYWCLAIGMLTMILVSTILTLRQRSHGFSWPHMRTLRYPVRFSGHILGSGVAWYAYSNSDFLAAGRVLGQAALGAYTLAWNMASAPVDKITNLMLRVVPSFFAAAHQEKEALRSYLLTVVEAVTLLILPLSLGLALVADQFVLLVLGAKWIAVVVPLRILLCYATVRALTNILGPLLNAKRLAHFTMWTNAAAAVYFPIGFFVGAHWGTTGVAAAWVVLYPFLAFPLFRRTFREIDLRSAQYLRALWPAMSGSIVMCAAILGLRHFSPAQWSLMLRFAAELAAGALVYVLSMLLFHSRDLRRLYQIVRPRVRV
ncbi:MAG TPA: lipopolysaccharide biosynthesis protein [Terriglobales bacterium]|nr:lipopolysaccharide biosynthesis protein [Terriglobales bacterium]